MSENKTQNPDAETLNDFKSVIENPANNIIPSWTIPNWGNTNDIYILRSMDKEDIFRVERKQISHNEYEYKLSMSWTDDKILNPYARDVFLMTDQEYNKRQNLGDLRRFLYRFRCGPTESR